MCIHVTACIVCGLVLFMRCKDMKENLCLYLFGKLILVARFINA